MPLRIVRVPKPGTKNVALEVAVTTMTLTRDLSNMTMFPPVAATASVLLLILQTVKNNRDGCVLLAHRCARVLFELNDLMADRWHSAPPALLRNLAKFTQTLESIHTFMKAQASAKWAMRLIRKVSIEAALADFDKQLSDAAQLFQMAMLIDISHQVLSRAGNIKDSGVNKVEDAYIEAAATGHSSQPPPYSPPNSKVSEVGPMNDCNQNDGTESSFENNTTSTVEEATLLQEQAPADDDLIEDHGFRRYHSSEVRLVGRPKVSAGWWSDTALASVDGQTSLVKYYPRSSQDDAVRIWLRDVKILQNIFHPNLPQMIGYSHQRAPAPFILLSDLETRPADRLLTQILKSDGVAACIHMVARYYSDITAASTYLQRQLSLSETQMQDFIEGTNFMVNDRNAIIMGLPPLKDRTWVSFRNYDLSHSLKTAALHLLPGKSIVQRRLEHYEYLANGDDPIKVAHLISLARGLLSSSTPHSTTCPMLQFINNGDDEELCPAGDTKVTMKELRKLSIQANVHDFRWTEVSAIPPYKFTAGDYGYVPKGADFAGFVKLGNIYQHKSAEIELPLVDEVHGTQFCWQDRPVRHVEMQNYPLLDQTHCWPVPVPRGTQMNCQIEHRQRMTDTNAAWRYLLKNARSFAEKANIPPEVLTLITASGTNQDFYIKDFGNRVAMNLPQPRGADIVDTLNNVSHNLAECIASTILDPSTGSYPEYAYP
ncbi:hypothetical protein AMATHDRAFT_5016 [Amanita thiersii Skay4041]|uniref:Protein kinase domain-containing protein n=1 Tax=Amanita thiersii Skay4041 TaxID=703135 RepID=A0A2A9NJ18_9AGAR|nr:hypothetical protein AMATHDRAFT_5016 [Amanita thiersii Skay4041]